VLEDDIVIALQAETLLHQIGCAQVVLTGNHDDAISELSAGAFDCAVLDVNLGDRTSEGVARRLIEMGVPIVVATGYSDADVLPRAMRQLSRVRKPYGLDDLKLALARATAGIAVAGTALTPSPG
jgi:DNA-binding NtrC family response regulator